jgi:hypothetical protein
MGLDMYLYIEKYVPRNDYSRNGQDSSVSIRPEFQALTEILGTDTLIRQDDSTGYTVQIPVGYWRKANAIHGWIINHADVIDNGTPVPLNKQDLYELREVCIKVLDAHTEETALELLPPTEGFFFGNNKIDEWYWSDVSDTIDKLNTALEQSVDDAMFEYYASW